MNIKESLNILNRRFEQKNILFVSGNVYDKFLKYDVNKKPTRELISLVELIKERSSKMGYTSVNYFRPEMGAKDLMNDEESVKVNAKEFLSTIGASIELSNDGKVYIVDLADILLSSENKEAYIDEISRIMSAIVVKEESVPNNIIDLSKNSKVIFIMRDHGGVIKDISNKNNEFAQVVISNPDRDERKDFLRIFANKLGTTDASDLKINDSKVQKEALSLTSGYSYKEMLQLARISDENLTFKKLFNIAKFNKVKSDWEKLPFNDVKNLKEVLEKDVKGQDFALDNVQRVLKNALLGINGAMNGENNNKPKGILFFAGPTGVGKTELAKSLTRFVFGDESRMIRFDMSEFAQEHSDQRLIGAPPGYVGYDGGGELTNAVRDEPQSIILFDEIEKAHHKILDKFLQILEDGRLTSSQGELIDFSETLIIFTSNIGAKDTKPNNEPSLNRKMFLDAVVEKFKNELKRPEILNRIGVHNVIPFDYLNDDKILKEIYLSKINKLASALQEKHNITLEIKKEDEDDVFEVVKTAYDPSNGGRGLISAIEVTIQNNLTDFLFENEELVKGDDKELKTIFVSSSKTKIKFELMK